jgi:hypothetical protein
MLVHLSIGVIFLQADAHCGQHSKKIIRLLPQFVKLISVNYYHCWNVGRHDKLKIAGIAIAPLPIRIHWGDGTDERGDELSSGHIRF